MNWVVSINCDSHLTPRELTCCFIDKKKHHSNEWFTDITPEWN